MCSLNLLQRSCSNPVLGFAAAAATDASVSVPSVSASYYMMEAVSRLRLQKRKLPWFERPGVAAFGWPLELHLKYTLGKIRLNSNAYRQLLQYAVSCRLYNIMCFVEISNGDALVAGSPC